MSLLCHTIIYSDNFMHGLYRMFLGDARPNSDKDDWIFLEVDCIQQIIIPAARIALKVHQVQAPPPPLVCN